MASRTRIFLHLSVIFILHLHHLSAAQDAVKGGYWFPGSEFQVSNIDSSLFTHLFCAFADLDSKTNELTISSENLAAFSNFTRIVQLKNPSVKTLLSIGGGTATSSTFASMASQATSRKSFIDSSIKVARTYGFHGLDLDWQYQSMSSEMTSMGLLLEEWRVAINNESTNFGSTPLILTAALAYRPQSDSVDYPIETLSNTLDWINAMAYDFSSPNRSDVTRSHAALYDPIGQASASYGIEAWIEAGMSAKKLVLGFPFYGYAWRLVDPANHGLFAPANGPDQSIVYVQDGSIGYDQINGFISEKVATKVHNSTIVSDYCYAGTTWIGYDDTLTISSKVKYAKEKGLLGYFAWHVGADYKWTLSQQALEGFKDNGKMKNLLVIILVPIVVFVLLIGLATCYLRRRAFKSRGAIQMSEKALCEEETDILAPRNFDLNPPNLQVFSFASVEAATSNFSHENLLGKGGFGPVYMGTLPQGKQIAVKRLSKTSNQGLEEFKNEVKLTAKLQHVNLLRVLGYCIEREEKMLIYEYMPNNSLDLYLFDPIRRHVLDWDKRIHIIEGIVQGLVYLHEYSNYAIVHRDLKSGNILLDDEMNPKISDFGMARVFKKDELEANTSRIVGTYGYIPPEYVRKGIYSRKYDVYSFGVLLLHIISGKRNTCYYGLNENLHLLEYAYELWKEGRCMEFMDQTLDDSSSSCKLIRCMQIGLLCVQENPVDRPSMLEVSTMLKNKTMDIATPKKPAFSLKRDEDEADTSKRQGENWSVNSVSFSQMVPR